MSSEQRQNSLTVMSELSVRLTELLEDLKILGPEVFRGDSWQMLVASPKYALHVVGYLRAGLKSRSLLDTRVGVGVGNGPLPASDLGRADSSVFRLSGRALDDMKRGETLICRMDDGFFHDAAVEALLNSSLKFAARCMEEWSYLEAFAIHKILEGKTHQDIALEWPGGETSQQNVAGALKRAGWPQLQYLFNVYYSLFS